MSSPGRPKGDYRNAQHEGTSVSSPQPASDEIDRIYADLRRGLGREAVTDENVQALIKRAQADGHSILAEELREWQAPCGTPVPNRPTGAPRPNFNEAHKRH